MHSNTSRFSDRKKKRTPTFPIIGRPAQVSFDHQKMARLEEAALAIQLKAIARAGAPRTSSKSPSSSKSKPEKKNRPSDDSGKSEQFVQHIVHGGAVQRFGSGGQNLNFSSNRK